MDHSLRQVLGRHLSRINVDAILRKVYEAEQIQPERMTPSDLERIFQNSLFSTVRMFCEPRQLTTVMLDLADLMEGIPEPVEKTGFTEGESKWT